MHQRSQRWSLLRLANLAGVAHKVAYEARDRSVLVPQILSPDDVLPLRTFDALRRVTWPRQNHARNAPNRLRLWEVIAIERSRMELEDVPALSGLYVHPAGAHLVMSAGRHAVCALQLAQQGSPYLYLPLGVWAQQAREALVRLPGQAPAGRACRVTAGAAPHTQTRTAGPPAGPHPAAAFRQP